MAPDQGVQGELRRVARLQNGVITRRQMVDAGLTPAVVKARIGSGQLHRLHRGVYAVGDPALLPFASRSAALLAAGPSAVLSYRSAAAVWSLAADDPAVVDVTLVGENARRRGGVRIHRVSVLNAADVSARSNLRLTSPARTLIDFAAGATVSEMEHALAEARALRLITDARLEAALSRAGDNHPGAARVRALLRHHVGRVTIRSEIERTFLGLIHKASLPKPLVNVLVQGYEPDFYWPQHNLVVEVDGFAVHGSRPAFERDRKRDQVFAAAGIQVLRTTDMQLELEPVAVAVRIGQALAARAADPLSAAA
jgi:predicted transcriptional regulator of viral defense system